MKKITFFKTLLLAIVMMVGSASASAQLLTEDFNYTIGSTITATLTADPTTGWLAHSGNGTANIPVTAGLSFTGYAGSGIGGAASLVATGQDINKTFTSQTSGTIYAAFMMQTQATNSAGYFFMLCPSPAASTFFSRVWMNGTGSGVGISGSSAPASYITITAGTPVLLVVKHDFTTHVSSLYVLNSFSATEPVSASQTFSETPTTLGAVALRQYNAAEKVIVDGIRIGTTWSQVLASASSPTISTSTSALTGFTYNIGSGPSTEKTFTVGGSNLTNDITVTAAIDYEISTGTGGAFVPTSPITILMANAGTPTTIYARLKSGLAVGNYNSENIIVASAGATSANVVCSGSVACLASGIVFAEPTVNKLLSDAAFMVTPTTSSTGAITYTSATPAVATVDASTGLVTLLTAGSTVITASQAADATYCAATAPYTLNVAPTTPTITVTENTIADFAANVGSTSTKTATVSGINLTAGITLAVSGTDATLFTLSQYSVAQSGGTAASTPVTITYTPTSSGTHTATLTLSSAGATDVTRTLTGNATWAPLSTPLATVASSIYNNGFTANWDVVSGATSYDLDVYTKTGGGITSETEAFDGITANGNLIGSATYLTGWSVSSQSASRQIYTTTGNFGVAAPSFAFTTTADYIETATYLSPITTFSFWAKQQSGATSSTLIEGYNGSTWTTIVTLSNADVATAGTKTYDLVSLGKTDIVKIKMTYTKVAGNLSIDDITVSSGSGFTKTSIAGYPVTGITDNFKAVTGLTLSSIYYYTVTAKNSNVSSSVSNEIMVSTTPISAVDKVNSTLSITTHNGNIQLNAVAGETITVYNAIGQKILSKSSIDGLNTFTVAAHGVVMVKVGNRVGKVIL
jgi:hypothetical protein